MGNIAVASAWLLGAIFIVFGIGHAASVSFARVFYGFDTTRVVRLVGAMTSACAGVALLLPEARLVGATIGVMIMGAALTTSLLEQRFRPAGCWILISTWLTVGVAYAG